MADYIDRMTATDCHNSGRYLPQVKRMEIPLTMISKEVEMDADIDVKSLASSPRRLRTANSSSPILVMRGSSGRISVPSPPASPMQERSDTRLAIREYRHLTDITRAATPLEYLDNELGRLTPMTPQCSTPFHTVQKIDELIKSDVVSDLFGRPSQNQGEKEKNWNIKSINRHFGWGGNIRFRAQVRSILREKGNESGKETSRDESAHCNSQPGSNEDDEIDTESEFSQRRAIKRVTKYSKTYIRKCKELNVLPEPLVISRNATNSLDLSYYGVGDKPGIAISECLDQIPRLETLVLKENRFSDQTLAKLITSSKFQTLIIMDISNNKVGKKSSQALGAFLSQANCLETLDLTSCALKDRILKPIFEGLSVNKTISKLNLSKNHITDAVGTMLYNLLILNSTLTEIKLCWNSIRSTSAQGIAEALKHNSSLQTLDLSWNGLGNGEGHGAMALANSLRFNNSLHFLSMKGNHLRGASVLALANAWVDNSTLEKLELDDNPIGQSGVRAVFRAYSNPLAKIRGRSISIHNCNIDITETKLFDPLLLAKDSTFSLDMSKGLDPAIASEILRKANTNKFFKIMSLEHTFGSKTNKIHVSTVCQLNDDTSTAQTKDGNVAADSQSLGIVSVVNSKASVGGKNKYVPWRVPNLGKLLVEYTSRDHAPLACEVIDDSILEHISTFLTDRNKAKMVKLIITDHVLTSMQAKKLLVQIDHIENHPNLLSCLIEHVVDTENLMNSLSDGEMNLSQAQIEAIKKTLGSLGTFDPIMPNGHYMLDLSRGTDRTVFSRLLSISGESKMINKHEGGADTSEKGNWECFRNERYLGESARSIVIRSSMDVPEERVIEFDFLLPSRDVQDGKCVSETDLQMFIDEIMARNRETALRKLRSLGGYGVVQRISQQPIEEGNTRSITASRRTASVTKRQAMRRKNITANQMISEINYNKEEEKIRLKRLTKFFAQRFLSAEQLILQLCSLFIKALKGRVSCVVALFHRVIDLENVFPLAVQHFEPHEVQQLIRRVGWLNLWTPMKPNMTYELDLSHWEEREVAIMLAKLGDVEPGENWLDESYNNIPGWQLPLSWAQGKVPQSGKLQLTYYSGGNNRLAVWSCRQELSKRVMSGKPLRPCTDVEEPNISQEDRPLFNRIPKHDSTDTPLPSGEL